MLIKASSSDGKIKKRKAVEVAHKRISVNREKIKTERRKNIRVVLQKIGFVFLCLAFLGAVIYALFFAPFLQIKYIEVNGASAINGDDVEQNIKDNLTGKYLNWIDKNNIIFVNSKNLQEGFLSQHAKIKNIEVKKVFPDKVVVNIDEYNPKMILCSIGECFVIDDAGLAYMHFDEELHDQQFENLIRLDDDGNKKINLKDIVLPDDYVQYMANIKDGLQNNLQINVAIDAHTPQVISGDIHLQTVDGWWIYFNKDIAAQKELDMLQAALNEKIDKENQRSNLDYIDLRVDNKVFYKLKNQDNAEASVSAQDTNVLAASGENEKSTDDKKSSEHSDKKKK